MYLRFENTLVDDPNSGRPTGVFQIAYQMLEQPDIDSEDSRALKRSLCWFERNLLIPPKNINYKDCVFWFKQDSKECTSQAWTLIRVLSKYDHQVDLIKSQKPAYIIYEDDHQVAAVPFWDTF